MFSDGQVGKGEKPDHPRVNHGKFLGPQAGENAQEGVFTGGRIDIDTVTGQPGENLRFGGHGILELAGLFCESTANEQSICIWCPAHEVVE